jgi:hypothetical protein
VRTTRAQDGKAKCEVEQVDAEQMPPTEGQPWIAGIEDGEHVVAAVGMHVISEPRTTLRAGEIIDAFRLVPLVPSGRKREAMSREMYPRV